SVGLAEVRVVKEVENFGAELHARLLRETRVLDDGEVRVVEAWADDDVASKAPEVGRGQARVDEDRGVEPAVGGVRVCNRPGHVWTERVRHAVEGRDAG